MKPEPTPATKQTAQMMFNASGEVHLVAARTEADAADSHAVNGDLLAWGDYNEQMEGNEDDSGI